MVTSYHSETQELVLYIKWLMSGDTNQLDTNIDQTLVTSVPDKSSLLLPRPGEIRNSQCTQLLEKKKIRTSSTRMVRDA